MAFDFDDDTVITAALGANARLFGAESATAPEPSSYSRTAILNYISSALAAVAASGSASDLSAGTLPLGRLHGRIADFANINDYVKGDLFYFDGANIVNLAPGTAGQVLQTGGSGANPSWVHGPTTFPWSIEFLIDGGGGNITAGVKGYLEVPFGGVITSWQLFGDASGSVTVDIWKCTYAQFDGGATHPVLADSITGSATPSMSSATKNSSSTLTGWTTTLSQGDVLAFSLPSSATGIARLTLALQLTRVL